MSKGYMPKAKTVEWKTPRWLFEKLVWEFGEFDLDPAATEENALCETYYTEKEDGLKRGWFGKVYCNPPYGAGLVKWVRKAVGSVNNGYCSLVVMLLPARTDTIWFHKYLYEKPNVEIRFLKGRLKYGGQKHCAPFPSMIVIIRKLNST